MSQLVQFIDGQWLAGAGKPFESKDPAKNQVIWQGEAASAAQVEAAVKAAVIRRAREAWFLVDDTKFAQVYPAVICDLHSGAILTNRCPNPKYRQYTLIKETEV